MMRALQPRESQTVSRGAVALSTKRTLFPLGSTLTLRCPVVQASLGSCDGPRLAAAVSRAGALGSLTINGGSDIRLKRRLIQLRRLTKRPVLIAFTPQWQRETVLNACLEQGFHHFQVFWWNGPRLSHEIHAVGGTVFWQVGTVEQAKEALENGADILVAPGTDAGGQVRSPYSLQELLEKLQSITAGQVPIVAGGGLANVRDVATILSQGASAALMGTRFLLSEEAQAERHCKIRLARADVSDLILDPQVAGEWPCAPRRYLRTASGADFPALFAGRGISSINDVRPAAEIVRRLTPAQHRKGWEAILPLSHPISATV